MQNCGRFVKWSRSIKPLGPNGADWGPFRALSVVFLLWLESEPKINQISPEKGKITHDDIEPLGSKP